MRDRPRLIGCADNSSPSKAARAPASRPRRRCWRKRLRALGIGVVLTREPGGSPGAEIIRHVLLSGAAKPLGAEAEAILFAAARDDHRAPRPSGRRWSAAHWVICDRFIEFDARLSGRARQCRCAADPRARALTVGDAQARPHLHARRAARGRARARQRRGAATARPTGSRRRRSSSTRSCARPIWSSPSASRSAAS